MQDVGYLDLAGCMALGATGPILRSAGLPHDLRKAQPYCGYETYDFEVPTADTCDSYGRFLIRLEEMRQSLRIVEQCLDRLEPGPVMVADKKIAWPAQLALGPDGLGNSLDHIKKIMGTSMEALIHHFKLVTEGFRVPPGQAYAAVESPKGELGRARRLRRRHPPLPGPLPRPVLHQPAGHGGDVRGRPGRRRHRRRRVHRPRDGRRRPVTTTRQQGVSLGMPQLPAPDYPADVRARLEADAQEIIARYPDSRSALLPLLHLVQSEEGYVTRTGMRFCAEMLDLTTAEVTAVATFYSMYRRKPARRLPGRRLHQHAVRGDGRRRDLRRAPGAPGRRQRRDHRGRQGHPGAHRVQRGLRLRARA